MKYIVTLVLALLINPSLSFLPKIPKIDYVQSIPSQILRRADSFFSNLDESSSIQKPSKCLYFTGAGVYFWWQAGTAKYIQRNYDLRNIPLVGASAGSLTSLLLLSGCDIDKAASAALKIAFKADVFQRKGGLVGIVGSLIKEWLNEIVPDDISEEQLSQLSIALTPVGKKPFLATGFKDKEDVINACLASCHVPIFLDGRVVTDYRGQKVFDGSFWYFVSKDRYSLPLPEMEPKDIIWIDYGDDDVFMQNISGNFLETIAPNSLYDMINDGYKYMERIHSKQTAKVLPSTVTSQISQYMNQFLSLSKSV